MNGLLAPDGRDVAADRGDFERPNEVKRGNGYLAEMKYGDDGKAP